MSVSMIPPAGAAAFLTAAGWEGARVEPLAGDASFRRYFRVLDDARSAVLMDAPPPHEDPRPFVHVAEYLTQIGLSAPRILHRDLGEGLLLIEDFGGNRMREYVDGHLNEETSVYRGVVDVLIELHNHQPASGLTPHGIEQWLTEVGLFTEWYCPATGIVVDEAGFAEAWRKVLAPVEAQGQTVTELRDFHAENIMLIDGAEGHARFGLLDFQDALIGHPAYDLVSMLQDARRDVTPSVERDMLNHYCAATRQSEEFEAAYWALAAQRNTRILGVFTRLWKRDGKPHYTSFQPRMWGLLERDLAHPSLEPLRQWFDANVPAAARTAHWQNLTL
jgi:N-acetylmuramate 1-kinase